MYVESWWKCLCEHCSTVNWLCVGDATDLSAFDPHALQCRKCKQITTLSPFAEIFAEEADAGMSDPRRARS